MTKAFPCLFLLVLGLMLSDLRASPPDRVLWFRHPLRSNFSNYLMESNTPMC